MRIAAELNPGQERPALEAIALEKRFGPVRAVADLSFAIARGSFVTVFGPNGAGKSTLLRLLCGLARPRTGEVRVLGSSLRAERDAVLRRIGMLSHRTGLYPALSARENLAVSARLFGLREAEDRIAAGLAAFGMDDRADEPVRTLSHGMRQRVALARTLLHEPDVVLLDEPFSGLDVHAAALLRETLGTLRERSRTVVMVTHQVEEGLRLADRVVIQQRGGWVYDRPADDAAGGDFASVYRSHAVTG